MERLRLRFGLRLGRGVLGEKGFEEDEICWLCLPVGGATSAQQGGHTRGGGPARNIQFLKNCFLSQLYLFIFPDQ